MEHGVKAVLGENEVETAFRTYCGEDIYMSLNQSLRQVHHREWENTTFFLNYGICTAAKPPGRHPVLYAGLNNVKVKLAVGQTLYFKEFRSTSRSIDVAKSFGTDGVLLVFKTWKVGTDVSPYSPFAEEETLLAPYQGFAISEIKGNFIFLDTV